MDDDTVGESVALDGFVKLVRSVIQIIRSEAER